MSEMNVKMTFTLGGTAAAGVKAIEDSFLSLQKVIDGINQKLASYSGTSFGSGMVAAMKSATTEIGAMDRAMFNEMSLNGMRQAALDIAHGEASIIEARRVAEEKIAIERRVSAEKAIQQNRDMELQRMRWASELEGERASAAQKTLIQNRQYAEHIAAAKAAAAERVAIEKSANDQIKGMAEMYAAFKIEKGLGASVSEATKFQTEEIRLKLLNLPQGEAESITQKAFDTSKALKFASALDVIIARQQVMGGLAEQMDKKVLDAVVPQVMKTANVLKIMGDKTPQEDLIRNLIGIVEARAQTTNPEAMARTFDLIVKAYSATGGKVTAKDFEQYARGAGVTVPSQSDLMFQEMTPLIDAVKIMGGAGMASGAPAVSTAIKQLSLKLLGGPLSKKGAQMFEETGIFKPDSILPGSDMTSANIRKGSVIDPDMVKNDLPAFMAKMRPNIIAYTERYAQEFYPGKKLKDITEKDKNSAIEQYITELGLTVTSAKAMVMLLNTDYTERAKRQVGEQQRAAGVNEAQLKIDELQAQQVKNFHVELDNLALVIGDKLLPLLTPLIKSFTALLNSILAFSQANPFIAQMGVLGAAIGGVLLAISGFKTMFGIVGGLADMFKLLGGAATVAATETVAAESSIAASSALIGKSMLRMVPVLGIAALVADVVANFEVGGVKIIDWIHSWTDELRVTLGLMSEADARAGRRGAGIYEKTPTNSAEFAQAKKDAIAGEGKWMQGNLTAKEEVIKLLGGTKKQDSTTQAKLGAEKAPDQLKPEHDYSGVIKLAEDNAKLEATKDNFKHVLELYKRARDEDLMSRFDYAKSVMAVNELMWAAEKADLVNRKKDLEEKGQIAAAEALADGRIEASNAAPEKRAAILRAAHERSKKLSADMIAGSIIAQSGIDRAEANHQDYIARQTESLPKELAADEIRKVMADLQNELNVLKDAKEKAAANPHRTSDQKSIDEYAVTQREIAAYDESIAKLNEIKDKYPEIAVAAEKEINTEQKARDGMLNSSIAGYAQLLQVVTSGFDNFLNNMTKHGAKLKDLFKSLFNDIASGIGNIIKQNLAQSMAAALGFGNSPQNSSGIGGVVGGMLNSVLNMGGGYQAGGAYSGPNINLGWTGGANVVAPASYGANAGSGGESAAWAALSNPVKLAVGTNYVPQDMMAMIHKGEAVIPAAFNASGYGQKSGDVNVHQYISVQEPTNTRTQSQIAAAAAGAVRTASARNR